MELNFAELDNNSVIKNNNVNYDKYWEQKPIQNVLTKKKKVSFDDILSNMNLVVDKNGALKFMSLSKPLLDQQYSNNISNNSTSNISNISNNISNNINTNVEIGIINKDMKISKNSDIEKNSQNSNNSIENYIKKAQNKIKSTKKKTKINKKERSGQ